MQMVDDSGVISSPVGEGEAALAEVTTKPEAAACNAAAASAAAGGALAVALEPSGLKPIWTPAPTPTPTLPALPLGATGAATELGCMPAAEKLPDTMGPVAQDPWEAQFVYGFVLRLPREGLGLGPATLAPDIDDDWRAEGKPVGKLWPVALREELLGRSAGATSF